MAQFIALAVSIFAAFYISNAAGIHVMSHPVQIVMPPPADDPAGVSGGGPVGSVPNPIPTPRGKVGSGS